VNSRLACIAVSLVLAASASAAQGIVSQGAFRIGADAMWARGIDGTGQTVAVLDLGFGGLDASLAQGELGSADQIETHSFDAQYGLDGRDDLGAPTQHGVRMAEIIHDVAPGAHLVLVNYHTDDEFLQAVRWITANGIPIVSHSNSNLGGPYDGTGVLARAVDAAAAEGVLWVNSAGNFGLRHWRTIADAAGVVVPISPQPNDTIAFGIGWTGTGIAASVAVERQEADGSWVEVTRSGADRRTVPIGIDGGAWRLLVRQDAGPQVPLDVFSRTIGFGPAAVPTSSIATPGDAAGSLTVGAVSWSSDTVPGYSSRGPTEDGRMKPEIMGPTYVTANPSFPGMAGTSAATPHVAGAAALLRQDRAASGLPVDPASLRAELLARARDLGAPGPDAETGYGMVRVDVTPPSVRLAVGPGSRPRATVRATDDGTMARVSILLDGRVVGRSPGPFARVRLPTVRPGRHRIQVRAQDVPGNVRTITRWIRR